MPVRNLVAAVLAAAPLAAAAQIAGDGTLGSFATSVSHVGNTWSITAGKQLGGNLFHSFSQFSVPTNNIATFFGPSSVVNIIGRVTGPNASSIDGLLRSTIPGANLWLINPKGVAFGPNAILDIGGSFHVSTADYLKLGPGGRFDATNPGGSSLTSAEPSAFGFLGPTVAPISVTDATLQVPNGKTLSLVGGNVTLNGAWLEAAGGRINIASLASPGEVTLTATGLATTASTFGNIDLLFATVRTSDGGQPASGSIRIVGGQLTMFDSFIESDNHGAQNGGGIGIKLSGLLSVDGGGIFASSYGSGSAGNIDISGSDLDMTYGGQIGASTFGSARGGDVNVDIGGTVSIAGRDGSGFRAGVFATAGSGATADAVGGTIRLNADTLAIGEGGTLNASTFSAGNAGSVVVNARGVDITGGGTITSSSFGATGNGGSVTVNVSESLRIQGRGPTQLSSGIFASSEDSGGVEAAGQAGTVTVNAQAGTVTILDGGALSANTFGAGKAGGVTVNAREIALMNGGTIESSTSGGETGLGGNIVVNASGALSIAGVDSGGTAAGIVASTFGEANAGTITVRSGSLDIRDGGRIVAKQTFFGNAGSIGVTTGDAVLLDGGRIESTVEGIGSGGFVNFTATGDVRIAGKDAAGNLSGIRSGTTGQFSFGLGSNAGGAVDVTARAIDIGEGGSISANTAGISRAGNVTVRAHSLSLHDGGRIESSTSYLGNGGSVTVNVDGAITIQREGTAGNAGIFSLTTHAGILGLVAGDAGSVTVNAGSILVREGGGISAETTGAGNAGNVSVSAGTILLTNGGTIQSPTFAGGNGGNVNVSAGLLQIQGEDAPGDFVSGVFATTSGGGMGGSVVVNAGSIRLLDGGVISGGTFGAGRGGTVNVRADDIQISGLSPLGRYQAGIFGEASGGATNNAGLVTVNAGTLTVGEWGTISASTRGSGDAGGVSVTATDIRLLEGGRIESSTLGAGKGGNVDVRATGEIFIAGRSPSGYKGGILAMAGIGSGDDAGSVNVSADRLRILEGGLITAETSGVGNAGNVFVSAGDIELRNGGAIQSSTFGLAGNSGNVTVNATRGLTIAGTTSDGRFSSGIFASAQSDDFFLPSGRSGTATVAGGTITIGAGGTISASTEGAGRGGDVHVTGGSIVLDGGTISASSSYVRNQNSGPEEGLGGSITISADSLKLLNGGAIVTDASSSDGGNITIKASDLVYLKDSKISASVSEQAGAGGNIFIDPVFVILDHSQISAKALEGVGGNIKIVSQFFLNFDSEISTRSEKGISGSVVINSPNINIGSGTVVLAGGYLDASSLIRQSCAARAGRAETSSFTGVGRGGLASGPGVLAAIPTEGAGVGYRLSQIVGFSCGD